MSNLDSNNEFSCHQAKHAIQRLNKLTILTVGRQNPEIMNKLYSEDSEDIRRL